MTRSLLIKSISFFSLLILLAACKEKKAIPPTRQSEILKEKSTLLYVGTYTRKEGHVNGTASGIYICSFDSTTGKLTIKDSIPNTINPSYLTIHPNGKYLYAVNEIAGNGNPPIGTVSAFALDEKGQSAKKLNIVQAVGDAPCHISIDASGKYVLVASYMGSIAAFPIQPDGSLGEASSSIIHSLANPRGGRQEAPHAHMIQPGIDENTVFVVDLGMDKVLHYQLAAGNLKEIARTDLAAGAGGRHLEFHPSQKRVYVLNELNQTIEVFSYNDPATPFERVQTITTLDKPIEKGNIGTSAIHIHPSGKFLYAANRGIQGNEEQSIAMYTIDSESGLLTFLGVAPTKGLVPRDFAISPDGQYLLAANQNSDNIITFRINQQTGTLVDTGLSQVVNTPVCLKFFVR